MLYRTVAAVARFDRYPPPDNYAAWTGDAVTEMAHDFIAGERSHERLVHLAVLATDERSFARLLEASVRNYFRSRARATDRGRLHRRIRSLLENDDMAFSQVATGQPGAGWWTLRDGPVAPWAGRIDELLGAASAVPVALTRWRDGMVAERASLRELCQQILSAAGGAVPLSDVVGVVAHRLGLAPPPISTEVDAPDTATVADVESSALASLAAAAAFDQLTPRDRLLLLVLDDSVREAAAFVGVSKTTAADGLARLRTKLAALLVDVDAQGDVLQQLIVLSARWADERTDNDRTAS